MMMNMNPTKTTIITISRSCIRCKCLIEYEADLNNLRGQRTRRYCKDCVVLNHRDESREYQRRKRLAQRS